MKFGKCGFNVHGTNAPVAVLGEIGLIGGSWGRGSTERDHVTIESIPFWFGNLLGKRTTGNLGL
jgi:hypothetical protein